MNEIYVMDNGWILVGIPGEGNALTEASVVRRWSNGKGIGALAQPEHKEEYTLDYIGGVELRAPRIVFSIPCGW
ncbi:MAG: hypothetical protein LBJ84_00250 [Oscillospiraceae bacterium]|jgi:hypothetical protein|nr:hypothetical protein [Oscillospiraceae bacterium]